MDQLEAKPYWQDSSSMARYPALDRNLTVDVAIIGAGITGLTAGYLLKRAGRTVAVIDRDRAGGVDTGHTTAHVTCVTDVDLTELVKHFGRDHAQAVWDAGLAALARSEPHHHRADRLHWKGARVQFAALGEREKRRRGCSRSGPRGGAGLDAGV